jgi:hypothetical protein
MDWGQPPGKKRSLALCILPELWWAAEPSPTPAVAKSRSSPDP